MVDKNNNIDDIIDLSKSNFLDNSFLIDIQLDYDEENINNDLYQNKLIKIVALLNNFFDNLKQDPDKVMFKWPNRVQSINEFQEKINNILKD